MSVCQYLSSEVHKPLKAVESLQGTVQKRAHTPKKQNVAPPTPLAPPPKPVAPSLPPPTPLVSQVMEMGFTRRHVEYAIQVRHNPMGVTLYIYVLFPLPSPPSIPLSPLLPPLIPLSSLSFPLPPLPSLTTLASSLLCVDDTTDFKR